MLGHSLGTLVEFVFPGCPSLQAAEITSEHSQLLAGQLMAEFNTLACTIQSITTRHVSRPGKQTKGEGEGVAGWDLEAI